MSDAPYMCSSCPAPDEMLAPSLTMSGAEKSRVSVSSMLPSTTIALTPADWLAALSPSNVETVLTPAASSLMSWISPFMLPPFCARELSVSRYTEEST